MARNLKVQKKPSKHDIGHLPHVVPKLKLAEVFGKVLARDMNMGAANAALQKRPEALDGVDVSRATHPFVGAVVDGIVVITELLENTVRPPFVGADTGSGPEPFDDRRDEGFAPGSRHHLGKHLAIALKHTHNYGLSLGTTPCKAFDLGFPAPDVGFVNLDVISKGRIAVNLGHQLANLVPHAPRRLVRHAQLALQFLRGNAMARRSEQVDRVEPFLKRRARVLERSPDHRIDAMAAPLASVGRFLTEFVKLPVLATFGAIAGIAMTELH